MPDDSSPPQSAPRCKRCQGALEFVTAIPKRYDAPPCEIFRCLQCGDISWIERT